MKTSSAGEECSGEERGTSNRHRKEERDEVRSKHSDDRGKRYRESNVSPIATRSTVKTRLSATDLDEDSSSAGEECSGEERGTSNRHRKEERDEVRSKHSDDRGERYRESTVSPIATSSTVKTRSSKHSDNRGKCYRESNVSPMTTSSTYLSNMHEDKYSKGKRKRTHYRRNISRRREEMERGNLSSSTEMDDSSPERNMLKNLSETETQKLKNIFKCSFGKLCCAIKDPVEVGAQLQAKRLLSFSTMEDMLTSPESQQVKAITLVRALYKRIKSRSDRIFTIIQVFLEKRVLREAGRDLWFETGTISIISIFQHHDSFVLSLQEKCVLTEQHLSLAVSVLLLPLKENQLWQFLVKLPITLFYSPSIMF